MVLKEKRRPVYFINHNKKVKIKYYCLSHANNTKVIEVFILINRINLNLYHTEYYQEKILVYFDSFSYKIISDVSEPTELLKFDKLIMAKMLY